jgi:hypothetical protein
MVIGSSSGKPESSTTMAVISLVMEAIGMTASVFFAYRSCPRRVPTRGRPRSVTCSCRRAATSEPGSATRLATPPGVAGGGCSRPAEPVRVQPSRAPKRGSGSAAQGGSSMQ